MAEAAESIFDSFRGAAQSGAPAAEPRLHPQRHGRTAGSSSSKPPALQIF